MRLAGDEGESWRRTLAEFELLVLMMRKLGVQEATIGDMTAILGAAPAESELPASSPPYCACGHGEHEHDPECLRGCTGCTSRSA